MYRSVALGAAAAGCLLSCRAEAHGVAGPRVFVNNLLIDDPAVADEAALPTSSWQPSAGVGEDYEANFEFDKRITEHFGVGLNDGYSIQTTPGAKNATGWPNLFLTLKYQFYLNPEHEFMVSAGVIREFPNTGSPRIGSQPPTRARHAVPVRGRSRLHEHRLRGDRGGADPGQRSDRARGRRDRATPFLFRRYVSAQPRKAGVPVMTYARYAVLAVIVGAPAGAHAHAFLERAVPPVGGSVAVSPPDLDLFYTEAVVPHFSRVEVQGPSGQLVRTGALQTRQHGRELLVPLPSLAPGSYTVIWHVTSEDTHKTEGHFTFRVQR